MRTIPAGDDGTASTRATGSLDPHTGLPPVGVGLPRRTPEIAVQPIPRVAVTRDEAARALGLSLDSFERHVQPELRMIRRGRMRLVPISELHAWADKHAERTLP